MFNRYFSVPDGNTDFLYANIAVKNINFALISLYYIFDYKSFNPSIYHDEHSYYFYHLQSLLTACGSIYNVFYNYSNPASTNRSQRLREILNIKKADFPLVFKKELRNTNIHFDERYEEFHCNIGDYNIIDENTDPYMKAVIETNPHLRTFDKDNLTYITYDRHLKRIKCDLRELRKELLSMMDIITENPIFESGWTDKISSENIITNDK